VDLDINDPTVRSAVLGRQVEDFLESDIGKYLVQRAEEEGLEALEELKRVSWWRHNRIKWLQNRVWTTDNFQKWLGQAYSEGLMALQNIEEQ
jgi:hypothetical protein